MYQFRRNIIVLVICTSICAYSYGQFSSPFQNLSTHIQDDQFRLSGFISTQLLTNATSSANQRLDPFNYRMNTALNIHSYGFRTQLSLHYSDGNRIYRLSRPAVDLPSFSFFGLSPSYKWATLHIGTRNMNFSKYSLSGHSFQGIGLELQPGKWQFSGMYGRLRRAQIEDYNTLQSLDPVFKRMGWGLKGGYKSKKDEIHLIFFSAYDDLSADSEIQLPPFLTPAENSILSMQGKKSFGNNIRLEIDYALSAFTRDKLEPELSSYGGISIIQRLGGLHIPKLSTSYQKALFTKLNLITAFGNINLSHERVDPEYRTMGALYFNNDFENITAGAQFSSNNKKWTISSNLGFQRNNLQNKESDNSNRLIASFQSIFRVSENLTINGGFSNYKTTQKLRSASLPFIETDSLVIALVNQNFNLSFNLMSGENKKNLLTGMIHYQKASAIENDLVIDEQSNSNFLSQIMYVHSLNSSHARIFLQFQINKNHGFFSDFLTVSPTIGWSNQFINDHLRIQTSASLVNIYSDNVKTNQIIQPRLRLNYSPNKHHQIGLQSIFINQNNGLNNKPYTELTSRLEWKLKF